MYHRLMALRGVDLADVQLLSKYNKVIRYLLCVIDIFSKYAWVNMLGLYNSSFKKWLQDNDIAMYSTRSAGKSVAEERFIRTLKNKIDKYMTLIPKNVYIDKLDDIVNEYNNTYHRTIKMKPIEVKDNTNINIDKEVNDKGPKFKVGDHVRISKYKIIFAKGYNLNWSEQIYVI